MAAKDKDTIYVDIDDEITGIIDKLKVSQGKVVALVLPKRASVFQSIVNMKLLKRAADSSKKNLVLITGEAGLLPLAGAAGVHVAKTLSSKPEIPSAPQLGDDTEEAVDEEDGEPADALADGDKTVGQLAGAATPPPPADGGVETLVLDDDDLPPEAAAAVKPGPKSFDPPAKGKGKGKKNKKLHIPNFERFRLLLIIGGLLLLLLVGGFIFATISLPKATISIKTDATNVNANLTLNLSTGAKAIDQANSILPAKLASQQKTYTAQVPTTGQKNNGNKASGSVTMSEQTCGTIPNGAPADVPAGTGLSSNGQTYITQQDTQFSANPSGHHQNCLTFDATSSTPITAQNPGASYNGATGFSVAGRSDVSVTVSSAISGGTDNIVHIVNQNDVNNAKAKIGTDSGIKQTVQSQLKGEGLYAIDATYTVGTPVVASNPNVGQVADSVTVTETVTYSEFGVKQDDLNALIDNNINTQIDTSKQSILDTGLSKGVYNVNTISATAAQLTLSTKATAGPALNVNDIKQHAAGQHAGAIKSQLSSNPDVTSVTVKISPFWVGSAPKKTSRITVNIAKPTSTAKANNSGANSP
jgi:hypothetical protein